VANQKKTKRGDLSTLQKVHAIMHSSWRQR